MLVKVKVDALHYRGTSYPKGHVFDLPDNKARDLLNRGVVETPGESPESPPEGGKAA